MAAPAVIEPGWRIHFMGIVVAVECQADLLQVIRALRAAGAFASGLDGGKEQGDQDADDGDDDQQLDQREASNARTTHASPPAGRSEELPRDEDNSSCSSA